METGSDAVRLTNVDIDNALENNHFQVIFQPIFDLTDGSLLRVESFVRWTHPGLGTLPPGAFISFFESQGRMGELTRHVFTTALDAYKAWRGTEGPGFSLNLAQSDVIEPDFAEWMTAQLKEKAFPAHLLTLECPALPVTIDVDDARDRLERLRETGARLAIEVRGRASDLLRTISPFPFHELKTGGSAILRFARTMQGGPGLTAISELIELARANDATIVAVGVEDQASLQALAELGFDAAQGNFLSTIGDLSRFDAAIINKVRRGLRLEPVEEAEQDRLFGGRVASRAAPETSKADESTTTTKTGEGALTASPPKAAPSASGDSEASGLADDAPEDTPQTEASDTAPTRKTTKKAATKKSSTKKSTAKKAATKKSTKKATKKTATKKTAAKKTATKKTATKKATKKAATKKTASTTKSSGESAPGTATPSPSPAAEPELTPEQEAAAAREATARKRADENARRLQSRLSRAYELPGQQAVDDDKAGLLLDVDYDGKRSPDRESASPRSPSRMGGSTPSPDENSDEEETAASGPPAATSGSSSNSDEEKTASPTPGRMRPSSRLSLTGITPSGSKIQEDKREAHAAPEEPTAADTTRPSPDAQAHHEGAERTDDPDARQAEDRETGTTEGPASPPHAQEPDAAADEDNKAEEGKQDEIALPDAASAASAASGDTPPAAPDADADGEGDRPAPDAPSADDTATTVGQPSSDSADTGETPPANGEASGKSAPGEPLPEDTASDQESPSPAQTAEDKPAERVDSAVPPPTDRDARQGNGNAAPAWANVGTFGMVETGVSGNAATTPRYTPQPPSRFQYRGRFSAAMIPFDLWPERPAMPFNLPAATRNPPRRPMSIQDALNASRADSALDDEADTDISIPGRLRRDAPSPAFDESPPSEPDDLPPLPEEDDLRSEDEVLDEAFAGAAELDPTRAPVDEHDDVDADSEEHMVARRLKSARRKPRKNFLMRKYRVVPTHFWPAPWKRKWREMRFAGQDRDASSRDIADDVDDDYQREKNA